MRYCIILVLCICLSKAGLAQEDSIQIYLRFPTLPPFSITNIADSAKFTRDDLPKRKATIIIIFDPDCEHCQQETKALTANINLFKKALIVMASSQAHQLIKKFYNDYQIADHPNIVMGRDPSNFFVTFYKVLSFPAIFLYDKKGDFVKAFDSHVPVQKIAEFL